MFVYISLFDADNPWATTISYRIIKLQKSCYFNNKQIQIINKIDLQNNDKLSNQHIVYLVLPNMCI